MKSGDGPCCFWLASQLGSLGSYSVSGNSGECKASSVLLVFCFVCLHTQVARHGLEDAFPYLLAMDEPGVVVTDANAAPGMLVKRLYKRVPGQETVQEGSDRAGLIGELVERVREHEWLVLWPDGTREVYKCGVRGRFQLCHVNLHDDAGAPLLARTVSDMAAAGLDSMPVTDGVHCCTASQYGPGQVSLSCDYRICSHMQLFPKHKPCTRLILSGASLHVPCPRTFSAGPSLAYCDSD